MKKKILALCLVVALAATGIVGASMAYLTDEAGEMSNVFNVGSVDITLEEKVDDSTADVTKDEDGAAYTGVMPGDWLQKEVTVSNVGKSNAYVIATVVLNNANEINEAIDEFYEGKSYTIDKIQAIYDEIFAGWGINYNPRPGAAGVNDARGVIDGTYGLPEYVMHVDFAKTTPVSTVIGATNWFMAGNEKYGQYWVDNSRGEGKDDNGFYTKDMEDYEICYTYYIDLPAGKNTTLFDGLNVPAEFDAKQLDMFDGLNIKVSAMAIQQDGFDTAIEAFEVLQNAASTGGYDVIVSNDPELDAAIKAGYTAIYLSGNGSYIIPDSAQGKTLTFGGNGKTVIATQDDGSYEGCDYSLDGSTVTFNGVTINTDSTTYTGYARLNATYNNCTINGTYTLYGNSEFNNCTFNVSGDVYNIWTWGAENATFNNCTFNSDGKAVLLYGTANTYLTVNDCTFNDNGGLTDLKAAIEIGNDYGKSYNLVVNNTVVNGYEINDKGINTGTTLWANKNSMGTDKLNVVVNGVDVY